MSSDAPATGTEDTTVTSDETTATTEATDTAPAEKPETGTDLAAELEKWKAQARKNEERAKANAAAAKELEQFKKAAMTEQERAIAEAREAARLEVLAEVGSRLVDAEVKAAAAGRPVDVDALLDGLDRRRFLTDDGQPDVDRIVEWVDRIAPKNDDQPRTPVDMGQGTRPKNAAGQITDRAQLATMTPREIEKARREGRLKHLLTGG